MRQAWVEADFSPPENENPVRAHPAPNRERRERPMPESGEHALWPLSSFAVRCWGTSGRFSSLGANGLLVMERSVLVGGECPSAGQHSADLTCQCGHEYSGGDQDRAENVAERRLLAQEDEGHRDSQRYAQLVDGRDARSIAQLQRLVVEEPRQTRGDGRQEQEQVGVARDPRQIPRIALREARCPMRRRR